MNVFGSMLALVIGRISVLPSARQGLGIDSPFRPHGVTAHRELLYPAFAHTKLSKIRE
jgi:hypothetical protein